MAPKLLLLSGTSFPDDSKLCRQAQSIARGEWRALYSSTKWSQHALSQCLVTASTFTRFLTSLSGSQRFPPASVTVPTTSHPNSTMTRKPTNKQTNKHHWGCYNCVQNRRKQPWTRACQSMNYRQWHLGWLHLCLSPGSRQGELLDKPSTTPVHFFPLWLLQ